MDRPLTKRLHRDYITVFRVSSFFTHLVLYILVIAYLTFAAWKHWTYIPGFIGLGVVSLSALLFIWLLPELKYRHFQYELFEEELEIRSGLIVIRNVLIPMVRVQHVELESGPLMRKHELASVAVVTAATTHRISGLKQSEAHFLKRRIGQLAKVDEQDD
ncbi:hypothetical protein SAMN05216378_5735 [Paenibacillus catalpae]|uniref:YdbS-like PH domain-containing protein n=1 Tax=Paenibacillus catalpae TaxID=1045775 RepID=A0A1I2HDT4_9BACL|nr:PH domain-containing protein [Paenibacillus catalpae]SFF27718.1 hypothetical protein SAMN05216378_5735 [Paenibacillus catalpae]